MYNYLAETNINQFIDAALHEDVREGDHSSLAAVSAIANREAQLLIKDEGVLACVELARHIFQRVDPGLSLDIRLSDGAAIRYGDIGLIVSGSARSILKAERLVLNCLRWQGTQSWGQTQDTHQLPHFYRGRADFTCIRQILE
ncbi:MAG: hypothetical protein HC880_16720 [Bacteroidia bacterium]|nr:hypothetical protein [Bacteroidia bacterium]